MVEAILFFVVSFAGGWYLAARDARKREARLEQELRWIHNHHHKEAL